MKDLAVTVGRRQGRLVVTEYLVGGNWKCQCDCGAEFVATRRSIAHHNRRSCGCLQREAAARSTSALAKHGHAGNGRSPTYRTWRAMHARCYRPENNGYRNYGARGIVVCERWHAFENFLADMGERPEGTTIDRVDNEGGYEPANCRWATDKEQRANRRPKPAGGR